MITLGNFIYSDALTTQEVLISSSLKTAAPIISLIINPDTQESKLSLICETPDAVIYYGLGGNEPTLVYDAQNPPVITDTTVVISYAVAPGLLESDEVELTLHSLAPYKYSDASDIQTLTIAAVALGIEFVNLTPSPVGIREISATVRVFNTIDNTTNTDGVTQYYYSFTPEGDSEHWMGPYISPIMQPVVYSTISAGTMEHNCVLKVRIIRDGIELGVLSNNYIVDEKAPITTANIGSGSYPPIPLTVYLSVNDMTTTTTYYTTDNTEPTTASNIYDSNGIVVNALGTITTVKFFSIDEVGNIESPAKSIQILLDNIVPTLSIESISKSDLVIGDIAEIVWRVDELCNSSWVERGGDGTPGSGVVIIPSLGVIPANTSQTFSISPLSANLPNGSSTLYIYAADSVGNIGSASFVLNFDNQIPVVNIYETCRHTLASGDNATVIWSTSIGGTYLIRRGGVNPQDGDLLESGIIEANSIKETIITSAQLLPNVTNEIKIYVTTLGGNIGSASLNMTVDTLPPTTVASINSSDGPFTLPFNLRIDAVDNTISNVPTDMGLQSMAVQSAIPELLSNTDNFITGLDTIAPAINSLAPIAISDTSVRLGWTTDEPANSSVFVSTTPDFASASELPTINTSPLTTSHSYLVTGLTPDTMYWFQAKSTDAVGNTNISATISAQTLLSSASLLASGVSFNAYRTTCVVRWTTSIPTTTQVQYGISDSYNLIATGLMPGRTLQHEVVLTNLTPNRAYHFTVTGYSIDNQAVIDLDHVFTTQANRDIRPVIYVSTNGAEPTVDAYDYRVTDTFYMYVTSDTQLKYFAVDGFGNRQTLQTQTYTFDTSAPVITVDYMDPILLGEIGTSTIRFKVNELATYRILNQYGTLLASMLDIQPAFYSLFARDNAGHYSDPVSAVVGGGYLAPNTWTEAFISATDLEEGDNHITIYATDQHGNEASLLVGHITKDTIAPVVVPTIPAGFYNNLFYVHLVPTNLRENETITIYYTTDGTLPTLSSSSAQGQVYNILIVNTTTLRWFSVDAAGNVEAPKYATYVIDKQAPLLFASPVPGNYDEVIEVELKSNKPGQIFYTLNETLPVDPVNAYTHIYNQPIQILQDTTITCFAKDLAGNVSDIKTFAYEIAVLHDKKFKKVIGFQDKMLLETEFNEAQDNINRRIEELAKEVVGHTGIVYGFDIIPSDFPGSFEFYLQEGKSYIHGKFVTIIRNAQSFVPSPLEVEGNKTYYIILSPNETIFRPTRPGHPGWEEGVPDITTYRLEESYLIRVVEELPDSSLDPYIELYEVIRPDFVNSISECTIIDKRHIFEPLSAFQKNINDTISNMQSNLLALGLEVESYKLRNLLGLKNAFVDTFESTKDVDLSKSNGYRYTKTRFEL